MQKCNSSRNTLKETNPEVPWQIDIIVMQQVVETAARHELHNLQMVYTSVNVTRPTHDRVVALFRAGSEELHDAWVPESGH